MRKTSLEPEELVHINVVETSQFEEGAEFRRTTTLLHVPNGDAIHANELRNLLLSQALRFANLLDMVSKLLSVLFKIHALSLPEQSLSCHKQ